MHIHACMFLFCCCCFLCLSHAPSFDLVYMTVVCNKQQTGKLSYTYWKGFEGYDKAWGLTDKYNLTLTKLSKEALELDRQYKIRAKSLRCGGISIDMYLYIYISPLRLTITPPPPPCAPRHTVTPQCLPGR